MDVCCLNRPFDDNNNDRISIESEAILKILYHCQERKWDLFASDVIDLEISRTTDLDKKQKVLLLYSSWTSKIEYNKDIRALAEIFHGYGLKLFDSIHLASAEYGHADVLFTTDKGFVVKAQQIKELKVKVINPVNWLMEVFSDEFID